MPDRCKHEPLCEQDHKTPINIGVPIVSGPLKGKNFTGHTCRFCQCVYVPSHLENTRRRRAAKPEPEEKTG